MFKVQNKQKPIYKRTSRIRLLLTKELHKPVRIYLRKIRIFTKGIGDLWAADLIDMKKYSGEKRIFVFAERHRYIF
jgi:hypothetical protein